MRQASAFGIAFLAALSARAEEPPLRAGTPVPAPVPVAPAPSPTQSAAPSPSATAPPPSARAPENAPAGAPVLPESTAAKAPDAPPVPYPAPVAPVPPVLPPIMPAYEEPNPPPRVPRDVGFSVELGGGFAGAARFPAESEGRHVEEVVDSQLALAALIGSSRLKLGLSLDRTGLGKDHYDPSRAGDAVDATYLVDTLALLGRFYFSTERPSAYVSLAGGPSVPRVRATGIRATSDALVVPGAPYSCSNSGPVGGTLAAAVGAEFAVADGLTVASEALFAGHFLSSSQTAFDGCAPASGSAFTGALRLAIAYRFGS